MFLTRWWRSGQALASSTERGATSVIVVLLLVPVLFGAAALSVDVGALMWERRQLQNGADAAVTAAAQLCQGCHVPDDGHASAHCAGWGKRQR